MIQQENDGKFEILTNKLTVLARFLIFLIAFPGIVGVIVSGITLLFVNEVFLQGQYNIGFFLLGITTTLPIFYYLFLKIWKKKIWYEITPLSYKRELRLGILLIYGPTVITSTLFYIFFLINWHLLGNDYTTFIFEFQIIILFIMPLESWFFCKFYKILFPMIESKSDSSETPKILVDHHQLSLQRIISKSFLIKFFIDIVCLFLYKSAVIIIILNVVGAGLYLGIKQLVFKLKNRSSDFKLMLNLKLLGYVLILQSIIQLGIGLGLIEFPLPIILPIFTIIATATSIILKIFIILLYKSISSLFIDFQIRVKWFIAFIINDFLSIALILTGMIYAILEGSSPFILIAICVFFLIENRVEKYFHFSNKLISSLSFAFYLLTIYAIFSFLIIIPGMTFLQTIIFSVLSITIPIILFELKSIKKKTKNFIQNLQLIIVFYEIGAYLAITTVANSLFIWDSPIFNYFFFISLSSLSTLYLLYAINIKGSRKNKFSILLLFFLLISFFGLFLLIEGALRGISSSFLEYLKNASPIQLFSPTGFLSDIHEFISTDGLIVYLAGLVTMVGYYSILELHARFKVISPYISKFNKILSRFVLSLIICIIILITFQSISGILLSLMLGTFLLSFIYESYYNFKEFIQKPPKTSIIITKRNIFVINSIVSLFLYFFIGLEILNVNITLAFNIALIGLMIQINFIQKLKNILDVKIKDKSILHLINAISLILSGILAFPSLMYLIPSFINLEDLIESIVKFTLILLPFLKIALKQFYLGKFLKEKKHAYLNLVTIMTFWILATVSAIKLTLDEFSFILEDFKFTLIISVFLIVSSFISISNEYLNKEKKYQGIYLIWHFSTSFIWQLSFIGFLTSSIIFSINSLENLILVFLGLFGFGIITRRNILYTSEIKRDFTYNIQSSKIFSNKKGIITRIGEIIRFINIISFLCFIYTTLTELSVFLLPEALAICLSILLLLVYLVPEFTKYIKKQVFRIFNSIYIIGFTFLTILSITLRFENSGIHIFQNDLLIYSILFCLILTFSSVLIIIDQLLKGEYITEKLNKLIHFVCVFGIFYSIYSVIISIFFDLIITLFEGQFNLLFIFSPLFLLYFVFYVFDLKKTYQAVPILDRILKWHNLALWTTSSLGLIISVILYWNPNTILTFGIFLASWAIYYSIKQFKSIILKYEKFLSIINESLIYINIIALSLTIFFFTQEFFNLDDFILISLFITFICLIGILYTPLYQKSFPKKILSQINSLLVFVSSIILAISIVSYFITDPQLHNYFEILLIPISGMFLSLYILKERVISKKLTFKFNQINELILFLDIGIIIFMLTRTNSQLIGLPLLISSFSLSILLFIDYYTIKLLTDQETFLLSFFSAFLLCSIGISITVSTLIYQNLKDQLTTFIFIQLFSTYWILKFVQTVYVKKYNSQDQKKSRIDEDKTDSDEIQVSMSNDGEKNGGSYVFPKKHSKFSPIFIMNKFAERVCIQWNLFEIGFIVATLALNIYFGFNLIFSGIGISPIQLFLFGISITSIFTLYEPNSQKFTYYYIQTLASILLNLAITWQFNDNLFILVIIPFVLAIIINFLATRNSPLDNIVKYVLNVLVLGLYGSILIHYFTLDALHWTLLISSIVFNLFTHRRYLNLTFNSLKIWSFGYLAFKLLGDIPNTDSTLLLALKVAILAICLTWEWVLFLKNSKWTISISKTIIGYTAFVAWIIGYFYLYISEEYHLIMGQISPPIMAVAIVSLILLKKKVKIFSRENFLNGLIMLSSFFMIYTLSRFYLFQNLIFSEYLSISLSGAICGFLYIFIFQYLEFKVNSKWIVTSLMSGSLLGGIFMYLLLSEQNLAPQPYTIALPIAVDLFVLMFFIAIGIYRHSFKKIWSVGVYAWTIVPLFNFLLISDLISGIKDLTDALTLTNTSISIDGSIIISIILCSLLYLPIILTKLKENLNKLVYAFWFELLILIMWGGINLFSDPILQIPFTCLIGLILLVPIYVYFKKWRLLTIIWPFTAAANIFFVLNIFPFAQESNWAIPLGTLIIGYYLLAFGYFPNIRKKPKSVQSIIIISGYFIIFGSIFALFYSFVFIIIPGLDNIRAVNLTFLVMSFILLTAKYFNMRDYIVKVVHALIFIINSAILIGVTLWLIPSGDFKLFGIFLAIAFAFGTTLSFQARKYIPKIFFELIWFGMALFFGLSVSTLLLTIFYIEGWAYTGVLIIITVLICIPIIRSFMGVAFALLILGVSMIIMELIVGISLFIDSNQPILFLDILMVLELAYIYFTRYKKISLLKDKKRIFETISVIWFIFTIIFSITLTILVNSFIPLNFVSDTLIFLNVSALHNLLIERFLRKNGIFHQFEAVNKILNISHNILFYIIYLSISIFSAIHIPVPNFIDHLSIFFLISFIEFYLIDQNQVKAISPKIRFQLDWILFFAFSICLVVGISLSYKIWYISLLLWSLLFFGTIYLNLKAGNKIYPEILKFVNAILLNIGLFSLLFKIFDTITRGVNLEFEFLFLNLAINLTILYLFMRFKIINNKAIYGIKIALALAISLYCEEISRIYFKPEIGFIFNLAIFLTILSLLLTREIRSTILIYCYWTILSFCSAIYILELTKRIYGDFKFPINAVIWFFFLFGAFTTTIYYCLANRLFAKSEKDDIINIEPNPEMNSKSYSSPSILMGHPNQKVAKQIYSTCFFVETAIVSISIAQGWFYLYNNNITSESLLIKGFFWISMIPLVSLTLLAYISHYIFKHKLWSEKNYLQIGLPKSYENLKFGAALGLVSFIFLHLWPVLDIWSQILSWNFDMLTLNLAINLSILYLLMRFKVIRDRWIFGVSLILSLIISLTLEELYRCVSIATADFSILLTFAIFLFTLSILNTRNIKSSKMAYGYWASIAYSISALIFTIFDWESLDFQFALLNFLFIFVGLFTGINYILAHRIFKSNNEKNLLIGHKDQMQAKKNFIITALIDLPISAISIMVFWDWLYTTIILFNPIISDFIQIFNQLNIVLILISTGLVKIFQYIKKNQLWFENEQFKKILEYAWNINGIYFYIGLPVSISSHLYLLLYENIPIQFAITLSIFFFLFLSFISIYYIDLKKAKILTQHLAKTLSICILIIFGANLSIMWYFLTFNITRMFIIFPIFLYTLKIFKLVRDPILYWILICVNLTITLSIYIEIVLLLFNSGLNWAFALTISLAIFHIIIEVENRIHKLIPSKNITQIIRNTSWILLSIAISLIIAFYDNNWNDFLNTLIRILSGISYLTLMMFYENFILFKQDNRKYIKVRNILGQLFYLELLSIIAIFLYPINGSIGITDENPLLFIPLFLTTELIVIAYFFSLVDNYILKFLSDKARKPIKSGLFISTIILVAANLGIISYFKWNIFFLSGLIFLISCYPVSPEKGEDTTPLSFTLKIIYRALIIACSIGVLSSLFPVFLDKPWIITLFILAFFGYVIWIVRRSEELYNLPIYWRFISSLGAIFDFIITVILLFIVGF